VLLAAARRSASRRARDEHGGEHAFRRGEVRVDGLRRDLSGDAVDRVVVGDDQLEAVGGGLARLLQPDPAGRAGQPRERARDSVIGGASPGSAGQMTRVVVVGAGHNGLVAAIHLAGHGLDVIVVEHAARPGGATRSSERTLPGFVHDDCAGFVPLTAASPALRELELDVEWVNSAVVMAHPFPDGSAIALHRDVRETVRSLGAAGAGWAAAMERLLPVAQPLADAILAPLPPVRAPARLALALRRDGLEWARRLAGSVQALGLDLFEGDRRATAWLAGSAQHSGLPPTAAASGAFGLVLQLLAHSHGWPLPRGGMQELADALVARARGAGVAIRCEASVAQVLVRGGRVAGVRLAGGEEIAADAVVSTVSAGVLARLLPDGALPGRLQRRLRVWRYCTGAFKLDYALSGPVPWTAAEARPAAVVHVAGELEALSRAADQGTRGEVPDRPALVVGQQSLHDPTRAPESRHTLYVYGQCPPATRWTTRRWPIACGADRALRARLRFADPGAGDPGAVADGAREPQPRRRRPRRGLLRDRPAAHLPPGAGAVALRHATARSLRRRRIDASGRCRARDERTRRRPPAASRPPPQEARLMPRYGDCRAAEIAAPPQACFAALTDFERLPEWQGAVQAARVLERDARGRGTVVEYVVDALVKRVRYRLRQLYDEPHRLGSEYLGGDFRDFRDFSGEWRFIALAGGRTRAELDLQIDPGRFVPGRLRGAIADAVMRRALADLKRHLER
jgi:phytoene dehydrogenase-like protein/ribosome-associated toxin RatA of RatAB toxin-antitoxin module